MELINKLYLVLECTSSSLIPTHYKKRHYCM